MITRLQILVKETDMYGHSYDRTYLLLDDSDIQINKWERSSYNNETTEILAKIHSRSRKDDSQLCFNF